MILSVGSTLSYQIGTPTAAFTFNVLVNTDAQQRLVEESIRCTPEVPVEIVESGQGGRALRCEVRRVRSNCATRPRSRCFARRCRRP